MLNIQLNFATGSFTFVIQGMGERFALPFSTAIILSQVPTRSVVPPKLSEGEKVLMIVPSELRLAEDRSSRDGMKLSLGQQAMLTATPDYFLSRAKLTSPLPPAMHKLDEQAKGAGIFCTPSIVFTVSVIEDKTVYVKHFIISDTVEDRILKIQKRKTAIVTEALKGGKKGTGDPERTIRGRSVGHAVRGGVRAPGQASRGRGPFTSTQVSTPPTSDSHITEMCNQQRVQQQEEFQEEHRDSMRTVGK
ncbi:hypothetical protein K435DRAFT_867097 [Dendrothele bispora CBS 962.96]|uniref:Uncharacterized protein n=1 Tax=Dendrothele bispora (strain CBS 962.96) TaxID=1314807 RepID=A0A4S8LF32_DENBC|nr:hypothetical protein K435DRAFT_867097 [Dendrothele bispora CBS 962.96]